MSDPDTHRASADDSSAPIPWNEPFGTRFVLERTDTGARLRAAPEPPPSKLYAYQALFALGLAVLLAVTSRRQTDVLSSLTMGVEGGFALLFLTFIVERFVWRSAPGRSSFPRVADSVEIRADFASDDTEQPYRAAASVPRRNGVVIDGRAFSVDQIKGVRLVDWRTREMVDPKMGTVAVKTLATLVLVAMDEKGQLVPYELDVIKHDEEDEHDAIAACRLLARLLAVKRLKTVHLPTNQGLHASSAGEYRINALLIGAVVTAVGTTVGTSTGERVTLGVVLWIVANNALIWWYSNREVRRRNWVAPKC